MKKLSSLLLVIVAFFSLVACSSDYLEKRVLDLEGEVKTLKEDKTNLEESKIELEQEIERITNDKDSKIDGAIGILAGDETVIISYKDSDEKSLFELIKESGISMTYEEQSFGNFINSIGSHNKSIFTWIKLLVNGEEATEGVDSIEYKNGDVFSFVQDDVTWESYIEAEYNSISNFGEYVFTATTGEKFFVSESDMPEGITKDSLITGAKYKLKAISEVGKNGWGCSNCMIVSEIDELFVDDFTKLYDLDEGESIILKFTITELSDGAQWGQEVKAVDANGLLSKDVTKNLKDPFNTGYLFFSFPDGMNLKVGGTYVAKFKFQKYPPNSKPQLGFDGIDSNGSIDMRSININEIDEDGNIIKNSVIDKSELPLPTCAGFNDFKENYNTGDQCKLTFTVTQIVWDTPSGEDELGVSSDDVMAYMFDMSWTSVEIGKKYTVTVEKQSNGQISLIGDLVEATE